MAWKQPPCTGQQCRVTQLGEPSVTPPQLGSSAFQVFPNQRNQRRQEALFVPETLPLSRELDPGLGRLPAGVGVGVGGRRFKISGLRLDCSPPSPSGLGVRGGVARKPVLTISIRMEP